MREQDYVDVVEESFENYSAHVIQERAIVDVRDAIKPSSRQALYAQFLKKFLPNKPYRKALESVGVGLGLFYTHGDASLYGLLVRMGQPFYEICVRRCPRQLWLNEKNWRLQRCSLS